MYTNYGIPPVLYIAKSELSKNELLVDVCIISDLTTYLCLAGSNPNLYN